MNRYLPTMPELSREVVSAIVAGVIAAAFVGWLRRTYPDKFGPAR